MTIIQELLSAIGYEILYDDTLTIAVAILAVMAILYAYDLITRLVYEYMYRHADT